MTAPSRPKPDRRRWSFPLVRIADIEIRVHVTFFLLVPLFAWAGTRPGGPGVLRVLVWLVVVFGCVVLHEFGHCFVARRRGPSMPSSRCTRRLSSRSAMTSKLDSLNCSHHPCARFR